MTRTDAIFIDSLVDAVRELRPMRDEHVADNEGEMLPHVLMAQIADHVVEQAGIDERRDGAQRILDFCETGYVNGDHAVQELLDVSFIEDMALWRPENASRIVPMLGPQLRDLSQRYMQG